MYVLAKKKLKKEKLEKLNEEERERKNMWQDSEWKSYKRGWREEKKYKIN